MRVLSRQRLASILRAAGSVCNGVWLQVEEAGLSEWSLLGGWFAVAEQSHREKLDVSRPLSG